MPATRERWLVSIESAKSVDELLDMLPNADAAALQGLLRRHQLPDPKLQTERVDVIKKAVEAGTIPSDGLLAWRDDVLAAESAIEGISDFRKKNTVIEAFRRKHNLDATKEGFVPAQVCVHNANFRRFKSRVLVLGVGRWALGVGRWEDFTATSVASFKLRSLSAGSILTLRNRIEPLAFESTSALPPT